MAADSDQRKLPALRQQIYQVVTWASFVWLFAVFAVTAALVHREVDQLMDDGLQESAEVLYGLLVIHADELPLRGGDADAVDSPGLARTLAAPPHEERLVWQLIRDERSIVLRSHRAPEQKLLLTRFEPGIQDGPDGWRVYAMKLPQAGLALYVGQRDASRTRSRFSAIAAVGAGALCAGLCCAWWLRRRAARLLEPLKQLAAEVKAYDPAADPAALAPARHEEFVEVHRAVVDLGTRLAERLERERAFSAHAAHALRTPLAGMDAQLAVAIEEAPSSLRPRLLQVRQAATRLQGVVKGLLAMFRSRDLLRRQRMVLPHIVEQLPLDRLGPGIQSTGFVTADPELLFAALANLIENSARHGARHIWIDGEPGPGDMQCLTIEDDGSGMSEEARGRLIAGLESEDGGGGVGLGLRLAVLVAQAHGGRLEIEAPQRMSSGFRVSLVMKT